MKSEDVIGHLGYLWLAIGTLLIAYGCQWGWIMRFLGETIWVGIGFYLRMTSIWTWGLAFMSIDTMGIYRAL